jgi:hypothetical protein
MRSGIENEKLKIEKSDSDLLAAFRFFNFQFSIFNFLTGTDRCRKARPGAHDPRGGRENGALDATRVRAAHDPEARRRAVRFFNFQFSIFNFSTGGIRC